jgi:hypothetical protein
MKGLKRVCFVNEPTIFTIPYEERKGEWMTLVADRCRFKTRIERVSQILDSVLKKHLDIVHKTPSSDVAEASYFPRTLT